MSIFTVCAVTLVPSKALATQDKTSRSHWRCCRISSARLLGSTVLLGGADLREITVSHCFLNHERCCEIPLYEDKDIRPLFRIFAFA